MSSILHFSPSEENLEKEDFHSNQYSESLLTKMLFLLESKQYCDVTLIVGAEGKRILAHRFLLAASSPYFEAMFRNTMREAKENKVILKEVSSDIMDIIIQFCYSGSIELREDNIESLFVAAHHLQFDLIVDACVNFLDRRLHHSNCLGFSLFAEQYNCDKLLERAHSYICENYVEVCKSEEFLTLNEEQISKLLASSDVKVSSEETVCNSLLLWIGHDRKNRRKTIPKLLSLIRLHLLNESYLANFVKPICSTEKSKDLLLEALFWRTVSDTRSVQCSFNTTPRKKCDDSLILLVDIEEYLNSTCMEAYYPSKDKWAELDVLPQHIRRLYGCVTLKNKLFLFGKNIYNRSSIDCLDLLNNEWTQYDNGPYFNSYCSVVVFQNEVYILGGLDNGFSSVIVLRWDPDSNNFTELPSMIRPKYDFRVVVMGDYIYAIGGYEENTDEVPMSYVERFNENGWTAICSMQHERSKAAAAVWNKFIYVFGGFDGTRTVNEVERYDADQNTWTTVFTMTDLRYTLDCVLLENKFFLMGGHYEEPTKAVHVYDPLKNEVKRVEDLVAPHREVFAILIPNGIP